jgi:hypothetical protein
MGLFTFLLYSIDTQNKITEKLFLESNNMEKDKYTNETCIKPTKNNPFMNVLISDYVENPNRPKACNINNSTISKEIEKDFNFGLYRDVGDIFSKGASDRQYMTNPNTIIPNDREILANWLYKTGPTGKEINNEHNFNL